MTAGNHNGTFHTGFRRMIAVLGVGAGLALVGIALGLIYLDIRAHEALELGIKAGITNADAVTAWEDPAAILIALVCGSLGAALVGSGGLLALFELSWFRGAPHGVVAVGE